MQESVNNEPISIILVTYNAEKTLQQCLDSIYAQPYTSIELIVIDGASTDNTINIIQQNKEKLAFWVSEPDGGIYDAMNKGLKYVHGKWVYFIGADDTLTPDFSHIAQELIDPGCIYYGSVYKSGQKYLGKMSPYQQAKTGINHQSIIYPAEIFSNYQYDLRYKISADHVLNMACHSDKRYTFTFKDYVIANFNDTGVSSTHKDNLFEKDKPKLIWRHFGAFVYLRFWFKKFKERIRKT